MCLPQGLSATLLRNTPANAIYLGNFEMLKAAYMRKHNCSAADIPGWVVLGSAGEVLVFFLSLWCSIGQVMCYTFVLGV